MTELRRGYYARSGWVAHATHQRLVFSYLSKYYEGFFLDYPLIVCLKQLSTIDYQIQLLIAEVNLYEYFPSYISHSDFEQDRSAFKTLYSVPL